LFEKQTKQLINVLLEKLKNEMEKPKKYNKSLYILLQNPDVSLEEGYWTEVNKSILRVCKYLSLPDNLDDLGT
jgi:hypothetical protein